MLKSLHIAFFSTVLFTATLADKPAPEVSEKLHDEVRCMALNLHFEARGEGHEGMIAVGQVTMNRVKSGKFPNSVCKVVKQKGQFSWYSPAKTFDNVRVNKQIENIAYNIVVHKKYIDHTKGSLYFHNESVRPFKAKYRTKIGRHIFYS